MFYKFDNIDEFNAWHQAIMNELGIPDGLGTLVYTQPIVHPIDGSVVATVDERADMSNRIVFTRDEMYDAGYMERPKPTGKP